MGSGVVSVASHVGSGVGNMFRALGTIGQIGGSLSSSTLQVFSFQPEVIALVERNDIAALLQNSSDWVLEVASSKQGFAHGWSGMRRLWAAPSR
jgi:hypothetical protein